MTRDHLTLTLLLLVIAASLFDIISDLGHGASWTHIGQEAVLMSAALALLAWLLHDLRAQDRARQRLEDELQQARNTLSRRDPQLAAASKGLRQAVQHQFEAWQLSASEQEVGWLLLKGLSIKEIATLRDTQEKTTRQQASAVYRKAGLPGRHAFAAWFMEDLM